MVTVMMVYEIVFKLSISMECASLEQAPEQSAIEKEIDDAVAEKLEQVDRWIVGNPLFSCEGSQYVNVECSDMRVYGGVVEYTINVVITLRDPV